MDQYKTLTKIELRVIVANISFVLKIYFWLKELVEQLVLEQIY